MTEEDIEGVIAGFARCAKVLVNAGFTGVQLHAAHGYLLSQFLSPRSNQREDHWGGPLENRARLLLSCVARVRAAVGSAVPVSVKLNSADFQRGGFDFNESLQVAQWLEQASVDLIEISGGTYEQPRLLNLEGMEPVEEQSVATSTRAREAYFVDFAEGMRKEIKIPLMVTGGLRRLEGASVRALAPLRRAALRRQLRACCPGSVCAAAVDEAHASVAAHPRPGEDVRADAVVVVARVLAWVYGVSSA